LEVTIIIVNYNSGELLQKCIEALEKQTKLPSQVIIVDNFSDDDSLSNIDSKIINLQIISLSANFGFAKANNIALGNLKNSPWVALLNPDAFPTPTWLEELCGGTKKFPEFSFYASNMIDAKNHSLIDGQGDVYHFSGLAWRKGHGKLLESINQPNQEDKPQYIFAACAGAALYKTEDIVTIGGFDEDFFCYMEDVDLSFRLNLTGKKGIYVPGAIVHHIGSAITGKKSSFSIYYGHRNLVWTYFKNMPLTLLLLTLPMHIVLNLFSLLYFSLKGKSRIIFKSKFDALKGLPDIFRKRRIIQQHRVISSREIFSLMDKQIFIFRK